jgi:hypothetical protein
MPQANQAFASYPAAINAQEARRSHGPAGAHARTAAEPNGAYSGKQTSDPETVIAELVNQYFRYSTTLSGTFLCW